MSDLKTLQEKKKVIERKARIRQIVFGMQDGLISIVSLMSGIAGATSTNNPLLILLTGITAAIAGALSMGTGEYLSSKSEKQIIEFEKRQGEAIVAGKPYIAQESLMQELIQDGLSKPAAYKVVERLSETEKLLKNTFSEKVLGLGEAEVTKPLQNAIVIAIAFLLASLVPILPYILFSGNLSLYISVGATSIALFIIGAIKGKFAGLNIWISGIEFFFVAMASAIIGFAVGDVLGPYILQEI